jgi:4-hydroxy-2-oxoheptanedioate aldolase
MADPAVRPLLGAWCKSSDPSIVEVLASTGIDYLIADQQHGSVNSGSLLSIIHAAESRGCQTFTRVAVGDRVAIQRALDLGVAGVIVPGVDDVDEARSVASLFDFAPVGARSRGTTRASFAADSDARSAQRSRFLPMVETSRAIDGVDEILDTPGVDGVYVGPVDLGMSLGVGPRNLGAPEMIEALSRIEAACHQRGAVLATGVETAAEASANAARGYLLITIGSDWGLLRSTLVARVAEMGWATTPPEPAP